MKRTVFIFLITVFSLCVFGQTSNIENVATSIPQPILLEKVEELTLYLFQQQDVLLRQQNQIEALQELLDQKD